VAIVCWRNLALCFYEPGTMEGGFLFERFLKLIASGDCMRPGRRGAQENNSFSLLFLDTTLGPAAWIQNLAMGMGIITWGSFFHPLSCLGGYSGLQ